MSDNENAIDLKAGRALLKIESAKVYGTRHRCNVVALVEFMERGVGLGPTPLLAPANTCEMD